MFTSLEAFRAEWEGETAVTANYLAALTDESLPQPVGDGHRDLGRIAWHIAQSIPEMMHRTGLTFHGPAFDAPVPASAAELCQAYVATSAALVKALSEQWTDETLALEDAMYGEPWKRGYTLRCLVGHEVHHRGQMSVLMRQAGLRVPAGYGPAKEDWSKMEMAPPAI